MTKRSVIPPVLSRHGRGRVHAPLFGVGFDVPENGLAEVDEVDLVDRDDHVRHTQQLQHGQVPAGLLQDTLAGVDEHDDGVRSGRSGHRVLGVLHVPGAVREDEAAPVRSEVAVGDVDGDALLAFGAQAVGEEGQVDRLCPGGALPAEAAVRRGAGDGVELVGEDRLGVMQEPAHQGGLAVVDGAGGREAEKCRSCQRASSRRTAARARSVSVLIRNTRPSCGLPWRPRRCGHRPGWRHVR